MTKVRMQVEINSKDAILLELLGKRLSVQSQADLLQQAYGTFLWIVDEMLSGRHVISVETDTLDQVERFKELSMPAVEPLRFKHYHYLVARPEKRRSQLYLKGRNMTVGQLIYKMRADQLSAEDAAQDMDLPLEQVMEAMAYYEIHRDLIKVEAEEDKRYLLSRGVALEPVAVSG